MINRGIFIGLRVRFRQLLLVASASDYALNLVRSFFTFLLGLVKKWVWWMAWLWIIDLILCLYIYFYNFYFFYHVPSMKNPTLWCDITFCILINKTDRYPCLCWKGKFKTGKLVYKFGCDVLCCDRWVKLRL